MPNEGKKFEQDWKNSIPQDVYYFRLKDTPSSFGQDSGSVRFTLSSPFDCFVFYSGKLFPLELKSTKDKSISIQRSKDEPTKMIKYNQIVGLKESSKYNGVFPGFVFNFRESETYWLSIEKFMEFLSNNDKKSINENDVIEYNGILIGRKKKRVRYIYNIYDLLEKIGSDKNGENNII